MLKFEAGEVEARLIEAAELWRRSPSSGFSPSRSSPFAGDGPWQLLTRAVRAGDQWEAWRVEIEEKAVEAARAKGKLGGGADDGEALRSTGLTRDEVARRDEASEWLALVLERDRTLVAAGVWYQAATGRRIDWARMLPVVGLERGKNGVRMRYNRAMAALADTLTSLARRKAA